MRRQQEAHLGWRMRMRAKLTRKNAVIGVLAAMLVVQFFQIQRIAVQSARLHDRESSMIEEIGQIREGFGSMGEGLNEVRTFLNLPPRQYLSLSGDEEVTLSSEANTNQLELALFGYIDYVAKEKGRDERLGAPRANLEQLRTSEAVSAALAERGLSITPLEDTDSQLALAITDEGHALVKFAVDKESGTMQRLTLLEEADLEPTAPSAFAEAVLTYLDAHYTKLSNSLDTYLQLNATIDTAISAQQGYLTEKSLTVSSPIQDTLATHYLITNKDGDEAGRITINHRTLEVRLTDSAHKGVAVEMSQFSKKFNDYLRSLNTLGYIEQRVQEAHNELRNTLKDKGFRLLLKEAGLTLLTTPREDELRIYYDIYAAEKHVSSIALEKATGVVNIVKPDGTGAHNLLFFDPAAGVKKKTVEIPENLPEYDETASSSAGSFNILIAGKHGSLVDTMIFTHIDEAKRTIRMVSIPRDLYYKGRKINSYPHFYGMPELKKVLSSLTGYELDKYILIDMYAFIEVIDLLGGIDIRLNQAVIDPSYRTVDNGVEGTLHYEPGEYHLSGKQALRLARTRKTSSDFARAERQQMILKALQDKARNFGFGDAKTIYSLARAVLKQTETDISFDEAVSYYFKYQHYTIESTAVLSSGNVLYTPPYTTSAQCAQKKAAAAAAGEPLPDCENHLDAYTLLPRNNNWNVIKWFFRQQFEE